MASVSTEEEQRAAKAMGWRTFRVRARDESLIDTEVVCPASAEAVRTATCAECLACHGSGHRRDIVVIAHGSQNKVAAFERLVQLRRRGESVLAAP